MNTECQLRKNTRNGAVCTYQNTFCQDDLANADVHDSTDPVFRPTGVEVTLQQRQGSAAAM